MAFRACWPTRFRPGSAMPSLTPGSQRRAGRRNRSTPSKGCATPEPAVWERWSSSRRRARSHAAAHASTRTGLADASLAPFLLGMVEPSGLETLLAEFPTVAAYRERLAGRPSSRIVRQAQEEWAEMSERLSS